MRKALKDGGWRYPAIFALVVQFVGGVNATALLFAGVGPALWIVYSWLVAREVQWRRALGVAAKTGVLTIATSLWWIAGLAIQGGYGLDVLKYTETVEAVARTSTPNEIIRGLGYWFFYGQDRLGPWIEASSNYTQRPVVIIAGYTLVALALLAAGFVRWRHKIFFVALFVVGVVIAVGAHPYASPTPLGAVVQGVRDRLDRGTRDAQHRTRGAPGRARDRGAARRRDERGVHRAAAQRAARARVRERRSRRRAVADQLPGAVRRDVLRQEPATTRGHPAVLARRRGRARRRRQQHTRARAPGSRLRFLPVGQHGGPGHAGPDGPAVRGTGADPVGRSRDRRPLERAGQPGAGTHARPGRLRADRPAHGGRRRRVAQRPPVRALQPRAAARARPRVRVRPRARRARSGSGRPRRT